jgi:hypothetical protein
MQIPDQQVEGIAFIGVSKPNNRLRLREPVSRKPAMRGQMTMAILSLGSK